MKWGSPVNSSPANMATNPPKSEFCQQLLVVLAVQAGAGFTEGCIFCQDKSSDPADQMLSQKRLVDAGVNTFTKENWLAMA
jgi:hypothetical protein